MKLHINMANARHTRGVNRTILIGLDYSIYIYISRQIHYGRYSTADTLRQIYYGRYTTADLLQQMYYGRDITAIILRQRYWGSYNAADILRQIIQQIHSGRYIASDKNDHMSTNAQRPQPLIAASESVCCNASPQRAQGPPRQPWGPTQGAPR